MLNNLDVSGNAINMLPNEICNLTTLTMLNASHSMLTDIPKQMDQLVNLRHLVLQRNRLTVLPIEICRLTTLQQLDVSQNLITVLPKEIGQLTNLISLPLWGNKLDYIPKEINQIKGLNYPGVDGVYMRLPRDDIEWVTLPHHGIHTRLIRTIGWLYEKFKEFVE